MTEERFLEEFKREISEYRDKLIIQYAPKLKELDEKIAKKKLELADKIFKFKKRLERLEENKFGFNLTVDDDGKN